MLEQPILRKNEEIKEKQKIWTYLKTFKVINGKKIYLITCAIGNLE